MEQGYQMTINRLPAPTWNWLHMNESSVTDIKPENRDAFFFAELPKGVIYNQDKRQLNTIVSGMGKDMDRLLDTANVSAQQFVIGEGENVEEPLQLHLSYGDNANGIHAVELIAMENSRSTIVMDYTSKARMGVGAVSTKIHVKRNASVQLIQVQLLGEEFVHLNDVGVWCEKGGSMEVIQLFLGARETYSGWRSDLFEDESNMTVKVGYLGRDQQKIDMNYVAEHSGRKTKSYIRANGILKDEARKLFRGTIDFKTGCIGAEGEETEDVLLLGEDVVNQTIPLILCGEEQVQGNHGATIGKLDEEVLFYLCSRGMTKEAAINQVAMARLEALNHEIPSGKVQDLVQNYLKGVFDNEME